MRVNRIRDRHGTALTVPQITAFCQGEKKDPSMLSLASRGLYRDGDAGSEVTSSARRNCPGVVALHATVLTDTLRVGRAHDDGAHAITLTARAQVTSTAASHVHFGVLLFGFWIGHLEPSFV